MVMRLYTPDELALLPTLETGSLGDLKVDSAGWRAWLSRGLDVPVVRYERLESGQWREVTRCCDVGRFARRVAEYLRGGPPPARA